MIVRMKSETATLRALLDAIVRRDAPNASRLLAASPDLARQALATGATRADPRSYFFEEIAHHAYAGDTPLHLAAAAYVTPVVRDLVTRGADVRAKNRRGAEPLHYAADGRPGSRDWAPAAQEAVVRLLVETGADANARDQSGVAPLHRAVRTRSAAAVRALLALGADPRLKNRNGSTPLHLAVQSTGRAGAGAPAARQEQADIIRLLLAHGARASDTDGLGRSVRECARGTATRALLE